MLSILIPVYNTRCGTLATELHRQATLLEIPFEILLADDGSCEEVKLDNRRVVAPLEHCHIDELPCNIGPAALRNYLALRAKYDLLLYLDADIYPMRDTFLRRYLASPPTDAVVCGGFRYHDAVRGFSALRFAYGRKVETRSAEQRNREPHARFIAMNFLIPKELMLRVEFDDSMHYGYEDAAFGRRLAEAGVEVRHVENAVWHEPKDSSTDFIRKTERAVRNLSGHEEQLLPCVRLLRWHRWLCRHRLERPVARLFCLLRPLLLGNLQGSFPSLHLFAFYKLGYFCACSSGLLPR